ncbi:MAG TPA: hypothetical protein DHW82_11450 [Spirochaetia bacterium]|nr:MAG: hypothetical protein A2Y41_12360 [Spirochaetes bacterium GWB1_36_13]HCL57607.1 hypothetical protein [Spirochaetia bacterium]
MTILKKHSLWILFLLIFFASCSMSLQEKIKKAEKLLDQEEYRESLTVLGQINGEESQNEDYFLLKGKLLFYFGYFTQAEKNFSMCLETLNHSHDPFQKQSMSADVFLFMGHIAFKTLKFDDSAGWYQKSYEKTKRVNSSQENEKITDSQKEKLNRIKIQSLKWLLLVFLEKNEKTKYADTLTLLKATGSRTEPYQALSFLDTEKGLKSIEYFEKSKDLLDSMLLDEKSLLSVYYAKCLQKQGNFFQAETLLNQIYDKVSEKNLPFEKKTLLLELSFLYQAMGDHVKASAKLKEAFDSLEEMTENENDQKNFVYAVFYFHNKDFPKAEELFIKLMDQKKAPFSYRVSSEYYLGMIALESNKYYEAIRYFENNLKQNKTDVPALYNNLAVCYINLNAEDKAKRYLTLSIDLLEKEIKADPSRKDELNEMLAHRLMNTAQIYFRKKSYQTCRYYLNKVLPLVQNNLKMTAFYQVISAKTFVYEAFEKKLAGNKLTIKLNKAIKDFQNAAIFFKQVEQYEKIGEIYFNLGKIQFQLKNYGEAGLSFQESLSNYEKASQKKGESLALYGLGAVYHIEKEYEEALPLLKKSIEKLDEIETQFNFKELSSEYFQENYGPYELYLDTLLITQKNEEALTYYEKIKSRSFLKMVYQGMIDIQSEIPLKLRNEIKLIYAQNSALNLKILTLNDWKYNRESERIRNNAINQIRKNDEKLKELRIEINLKSPNFSSIRYPAPVTLADIQKTLYDDELLLSYYLREDDKIIVFAVSKNNFQVFNLISYYPVKKLVSDFRKKLNYYSDDLFLLSELYETLFTTIHPLAKKFKRLIIVPDASLYYLPFEALVFKENKKNKFLLQESFVITYSHSAGILKLLRERKQPEYSKSVFSIGNANLVSAAALPFTQLEMEEIHRIMGGEIIMGEAASETKIRGTDLTPFRYIHLSTHGFFDENNYSKQAILLTQDQNNDGWLTLEEIYSLKLNSELVTLSACNTGIGKENREDGLFGLSQSFFYAGTRGLIASLWPVLDNTTAFTMIELYQNIKNRDRIPLALKKAKLKVYHDWKIIYSWAPFVYFGK